MTKKSNAKSLYHEKITVCEGLVREIAAWEIPNDRKYPDGVKYRMVLVDVKSHQVLLLYDNHYPKGHHRHLKDGTEIAHEWNNFDSLLNEFLEECSMEEKNFEDAKGKNKV